MRLSVLSEILWTRLPSSRGLHFCFDEDEDDMRVQIWSSSEEDSDEK